MQPSTMPRLSRVQGLLPLELEEEVLAEQRVRLEQAKAGRFYLGDRRLPPRPHVAHDPGAGTAGNLLVVDHRQPPARLQRRP